MIEGLVKISGSIFVGGLGLLMEHWETWGTWVDFGVGDLGERAPFFLKRDISYLSLIKSEALTWTF